MAAAAGNPMLPLVEFIRRTTATEDPVLAALRGELSAQRFPAITPEAGKMVALLVRSLRARRVLEVGTGLGYSGIWMARALAGDGLLHTIEVDPDRAKAAEGWFHRAGLDGKVRVHIGKAVGVMPALPTKHFDLVFIDADLEQYPRYWELAMRLTRPGGAVCADNAFGFGAALSEDDASPAAQGLRTYNRLAASAAGVETLILPLGDGLSVSLRTD